MLNLSPERFLLLRQNLSVNALVSSEASYTYDQLRERVLAAAYYLSTQEISKQNRVGILGDNNAEYVIKVLALWQLSAVPVPLNTRLTENEIDEQLTSSGCDFVIVQKKYSEKVKSNKIRIIEFPVDYNYENTFAGRSEIHVEEPAVIIFTSGSINKSRGVILSFGSLFNNALNGDHLLRYTHSDRWLASLPFYHIGGFSIITRSLLFGIPLIVPKSVSFEDLSDSISAWHPTFISLVATQLKKFVDGGICPNTELKNCLLGGGFSDNELVLKAYELGWNVNKVYGSTETASFIAALPSEEFLFKPNSAGRAVPTNKIFIFDPEGNELKQFEVGEIVVRSNSLMSGYVAPTKTRGVFEDGNYHTGDLGYLDDEGYLFVEGRKNYLISTGGENVNPAEVEKALLLHPAIAEAAVFPLRDEKWGEIVAAAIVLSKKRLQFSEEELKTFLKYKIAGYKIPRKIFLEEGLPKTELGKIEKDKLIKRYRFTSR